MLSVSRVEFCLMRWKFRKQECFKAFCVSAWEVKADKHTKMEALIDLVW